MSREDLLINRAVDGSATPEEWGELSDLARRDAAVWARLGAALADHRELSEHIEQRLAVADRIELPTLRESGRSVVAARAGWLAWSGWAAAAAVLFAWAGLTTMRLPMHDSPVTPVALSAEEALERYIQLGTAEGLVVRELPKVLVGNRPSPDGPGIEVVYIRQFAERVIVDDLYGLETDERGRQVQVPASQPMVRPAVY